jgi:hypothetical protein
MTLILFLWIIYILIKNYVDNIDKRRTDSDLNVKSDLFCEKDLLTLMLKLFAGKLRRKGSDIITLNYFYYLY